MLFPANSGTGAGKGEAFSRIETAVWLKTE
jgi:hypothetical protein